MKRALPKTQMTDAQLDGALGAEHDGILPSSGFADAVMFAVRAEASAPAPIPFPWKRAVPGMIAGAGALALLVVWLVKAVAAGPATGSAGMSPVISFFEQHVAVVSMLHQAATPDAAWIAGSLAIPLVCLFVMRRMLFGR